LVQTLETKPPPEAKRFGLTSNLFLVKAWAFERAKKSFRRGCCSSINLEEGSKGRIWHEGVN